MRKTLLHLIFALLWFPFPALAVDVFVKDGSVATVDHIPGYEVDVAKTANGLRVTYTFDSVAVMADPVFNGKYNLLIGGCGDTSTPGQPALPVLLDRFAVPAGHTYMVGMVSVNYFSRTVALAPSRPALSESSEYTFYTVPVEPMVSVNQYLPEQPADDCGAQTVRKQQVANVRVSPVSYNSALRKMRVCSSLCFDIVFTPVDDGETADVEEYDEDSDYFMKSITLQPVDNKAKAQLQDGLRSTDARIDYLVLTADVLQPAAQRFADWKHKMGYTVTLLSQPEWGKEDVMEAIASWYAESPCPRYALLFGDASLVSPYQVVDDIDPDDRNAPLYDIPSDFYYACLDGDDDYMADINLGRIPASECVDAQNAVSKIMLYEENPLGGMTQSKAVFSTYFQDQKPKNGEEDRDYTRTTEMIYNAVQDKFGAQQRIYYCMSNVTPRKWSFMFGTGSPIPMELQKPWFNWNVGAKDIIEAINSGCNLFFHRDHGGNEGWSFPQFNIADLLGLSNSVFPIMLSIDCAVGKYNQNDNFTKKILFKPYAGCASIIAASEETYSGQNDAMACSMFGSLFPEKKFYYTGNPNVNPNASLYTGRASSIGDMLNIGLINMERQYPNRTDVNTKQRERYHCFGDPSLAVCWNSDKIFENRASITEFGGYITVDLCGVRGYISFYDPATKENKRSNGNYATFQTSDPEDVFISVTYPGWRPLTGTYSSLCTTGVDNPKDNYIDSYEWYGSNLLVYLVMKYPASFGVDSKWKLNVHIQRGVNAITVASVDLANSLNPVEVRMPETAAGDIVRLTLTQGNQVIDKKSILISK